MLHRFLKKSVVTASLAALLCGQTSLRAGLGADPAQISTNQILLQRGLQQLDALEPSMDNKTKQHVEAMRDILKRVCLDRQHATDSEVQVAAVLLHVDPDRGPADTEAQLRATLDQLPGIAAEPKFISGIRRVPGGGEIGYVSVAFNGRRATIDEISAPGDVPQRAAGVAQRLSAVADKDPLWWTRLTTDSVGGGYIVTMSGASDGGLITADPAFAREWGLDPKALADQLLFDVRHVMDTSTDLQDATPQQVYQNAVDQRQAGDAAFSAGDVKGAEQKYRTAIKAAPAYVTPYERLASLYNGRRETAKAQAVLAQALAIKTLTPGQRRVLEQMRQHPGESRVGSKA